MRPCWRLHGSRFVADGLDMEKCVEDDVDRPLCAHMARGGHWCDCPRGGLCPLLSAADRERYEKGKG